MKTDFADIPHWNELAAKQRYSLPGWDKPCTVEKMELWLDRLNISKALYKQRTNTTLEEFIELNPEWPLRAFIGLMMEDK